MRVANERLVARGVTAHAVEAAYVAEVQAFWHRLAPADLSVPMRDVRKRLWARALARLGLDDDGLAAACASEYEAYRREIFELYPGALDLLQSLRAQGKRLGVVTNGFAETHHEKIALLQIADLLDAVFIADEVGMLKPDPQIFAYACRVLRVAPANAAMVGDRYERDIRGAMEAGLFTVWVNVRDETLPAAAPPPGAVCGSIGEVGAILDAASAALPRGL